MMDLAYLLGWYVYLSSLAVGALGGWLPRVRAGQTEPVADLLARASIAGAHT
ncbi:MAG: hypothetical protein IRY86_05535 [Thermorudis peleae]|nr:hypothetical protein [Thermorudis peleae]